MSPALHGDRNIEDFAGYPRPEGRLVCAGLKGPTTLTYPGCWRSTSCADRAGDGRRLAPDDTLVTILRALSAHFRH